MKLEHLSWDSDFFKFKVALITGIVNSTETLSNVEDLILENKCKLTYLNLEHEISEDILKHARLNILLVDKKVTFSKTLIETTNIDPIIISVDKGFRDDHLLELAYESGMYSRFKVDEKIGDEKFRELYYLWLTKSIDREIADDVFIIKVEQTIAGFVTFKKKGNVGIIGIIAVDANYRGRGFGKILMKSVVKWFYDNDCKTMKVITQKFNIPACNLYESCGFEIENIEYYYHVWNNNV